MLSKFLRRSHCALLRGITQHNFSSLAAASSWDDGWSRTRVGLLAALGAFGAAAIVNEGAEEAEACGIVGFVGEEPALDMLTEGLMILQNRGYDSAGVSTQSKDGKLSVTKRASKGSTSDSLELLIAQAPKLHSGHTCGIAHTRWATHGGKTDENAHPHMDSDCRISLVHNGTIENYVNLKKELQKKGVVFRSATDTEVIVQLIGQYMNEGVAYYDAIDKTLNRLEGTYGLAIMHKDHPDEIVAARKGSPIVVGIDPDQHRHWIASEHTAFARHTNSFVALKDGEVAVIRPKDIQLSKQGGKDRVEQAAREKIELTPDPHPHWTIKEILEQPQAVGRALGNGSRLDLDENIKLGGLTKRKETLTAIQNLIISGCGTSHFASLYGERLMNWLKTFNTVKAIDAAEICADSFPLADAGVLAVSQSGETKDVHRSLELAQMLGLPCFSITNSVGSLIARTTGHGVYVYAGRENAVASTKAFTTQVAVMALVAGWFSQNRKAHGDVVRRREQLIDALRCLPIYAGMTLQTRTQCQRIARWLKDSKHIFVLGKGFSEPIAKEGALKIKEITYIHAEGYSGGALKHGPFALLEEGTPVILIILDDEHANLMKIAAEEVEARGARTIVITNRRELAAGLKAEVIKIPSNGPLTALLGVIPLQLLAYEMAVAKGYNPDKPRNLAKCVTTD